MKRRWWIAILVAAVLCVVAAVAAIWHTPYGRSVLGIARLEVTNGSPSVFTDVQVIARDSRGKLHSQTAPRLEPGDAVRLDVRTPDLVLVSIAWRQGEHPLKFEATGTVCKGETLFVRLFDSQAVKMNYGR